MDVVSYAKAQAVDKRLTDSINAGQTLSSWTADRDAINAKLSDASKISQTLINGTSVINATLDAPATVEVQGRTLVSMGSSVLQNGKQFLLADKKTKIRTLGNKSAQTQGVAKFVQNIPTIDTAKFTGKVGGSTTENPHIISRDSYTVLRTPAIYTELTTAQYSQITTQDNNSFLQSHTTSGGIDQMIFQFNILEEIERNIGRIPKSTTADKVQWIKDNVTKIAFNWYGYGSSPAGNKATIAQSYYLSGVFQSWQSLVSHSSGTVVLLSSERLNPGVDRIDNNGFTYLIAYADASDGVVASSIYTDYIEMVITLSSSAQLDNRPILTRIANFEGKIAGSTVEVPHLSRYTAATSVVQPPSIATELPTSGTAWSYDKLYKNDGSYTGIGNGGAGNIIQNLFVFDVIQEVERQLGRIPKATLADKVQWCRDNINQMVFNWYGFGSGPNGYKSYLKRWISIGGTWQWYSSANNTSSSPSLQQFNNINSNETASNWIDDNGFCNFVAFADAAGPVANPTVAPTVTATGTGGGLAAGTYYVAYSWINANGETMISPEASITINAGQSINVTTPTLPFGVTGFNLYIGTTSGAEQMQFGVTGSNTTTKSAALTNNGAPKTTNTTIVSSTINTDYAELTIELKQQAVLHDPVVPLYQIDDTTEYTNILTTWLEAEVLNRYPKVQAVEHLQNVYAIAEGENLIPPFSDPAWTIVSQAQVTAPYDLTLNATASGQESYVDIPVIFGQTYAFSSNIRTGKIYATYLDANKGWLANYSSGMELLEGSAVTMNVANTKYFRIRFGSSTSGTFNFSGMMFTLGSTAKPFTPRNPSYLFATNKLGQIGTVKDVLYKSDGQWYVRKSVEKDVVLDGSQSWGFTSDHTGYKRFSLAMGLPSGSGYNDVPAVCTKYNGMKLFRDYTISDGFRLADATVQNPLYITVPDSDSGFGETYTPTLLEMQALFYGWQAKTVDANGKPTAWRSLGDGTDAPTQTLAYVSVTKAPNFTPYKLTYQLATTVVQPATVEGDIALNGPTQIEVGSGVIVREKVTPQLVNGRYYLGSTAFTSSLTKYKPAKFIGIYKNGVNDIYKWTREPSPAISFVNGAERYSIAQSDFDTTAEYTVTYKLFDVDNTKAAFTNVPLEFKATYDTSLKAVVDHLVEKQSDLVTISSVNVQAIAELYKRVKALGG